MNQVTAVDTAINELRHLPDMPQAVDRDSMAEWWTKARMVLERAQSEALSRLVSVEVTRIIQQGGGSVGGGFPLPDMSHVQYIHVQDVPLSVWPIDHDLDFYPVVVVVDSAGQVGYGDVKYLNKKKLTVTFSYPFSGKAYLIT